MRRINILIFLSLVALSGCDTLDRIGLEQVSDSCICYGSHCEVLRQQVHQMLGWEKRN